MNSLAEQIIADIIVHEMALPVDSVWIRDQNRLIPKNEGIFIVVGMTDSRVYSAVNNRIAVTEGVKEIQQVQTRDNIMIDILSRNTDAIHRRWEIIAALSSVYSIQKQEENSFRIFRIPGSFANTSSAEGGSSINRFSITVPCFVWYRKEKLLSSGDYYDDFDTRVDDARSIETDTGIIEFNITGDEIDGRPFNQ